MKVKIVILNLRYTTNTYNHIKAGFNKSVDFLLKKVLFLIWKIIDSIYILSNTVCP